MGTGRLVGIGRLYEWVQGDYSNGYRETIAMGTGRLQEWVQGDYTSGYRETKEWVQGD